MLCLGLVAGTASLAHAREMTEFPKVRLQTLDKGTARTMTFDTQVGNTVKFGKLYMKVLSCQNSAPVDQPESAAFIQIWEVTPTQQAQWLFSGWMFASSPALSAMDHPLYDVWVVNCLADENAPKPPETTPPAPSEGEATTITPPAQAAPVIPVEEEVDMLEEVR